MSLLMCMTSLLRSRNFYNTGHRRCISHCVLWKKKMDAFLCCLGRNRFNKLRLGKQNLLKCSRSWTAERRIAGSWLTTSTSCSTSSTSSSCPTPSAKPSGSSSSRITSSWPGPDEPVGSSPSPYAISYTNRQRSVGFCTLWSWLMEKKVNNNTI